MNLGSFPVLRFLVNRKYRPRKCEYFHSFFKACQSQDSDADKIKAKYVDGVLHLTLPKLEQRLPVGRHLEIE